MKPMALCASLLGACAVAGCGLAQNQADPRSVGVRGVPATIQQTTIVANTGAQEALVAALIKKAYVRGELDTLDPRWAAVAEAGIVEVDMMCDQYISALYTFNREQQAARQGLTAAGATTAAILGLTGAAGVTIALVAASFGLAATLFDAGVNSVLFSVSPDAVRSIAQRGRQAYLAGIQWKDVTTRPRMMIVVQGYLTQCSPAAIEANINNAATGAPSVANSNADIALKAAAMAAPSASIVQNPDVWVARPVTKGGSETPPPVPVVEQVINLEPTEKFITTREEIRRLQRALGTAVSGDPGKYDATKLSTTRADLAAFEAGMARHDTPASTAQGSGLIEARTYAILATAGPRANTVFKSAFERGLLGDPFRNYVAADPAEVEYVIALLDPAAAQPAATTPEALATRMGVLRAAIRTHRGKPDSSDVLDAALYDEVRAKAPSVPKPPPKTTP